MRTLTQAIRSLSPRALRALGSLSPAVLLVIGCTGDGGPDDALSQPPRPPAEPMHPDASGPTVVDRSIDSTKPAFQTKSSVQLLTSLQACLGAGAATATTDMIIGGGGVGAFLPSETSATTLEGKDDIVTIQSALLDGSPASLQRGTRVDALTLEYVTALRNIANVAGTRCKQGLTSDPSLCACERIELASAMLSRCLPFTNPATPEFQGAAQALASKCATDPGVGVASLIASAAFAKLP